MKKIFLAVFFITTFSLFSQADSRVFTLVNPDTDAVLQALQKTYGDKVHADVVQGRLLVVGSKQQLDEVAALLIKLDPAPRPLRLTLSEQAPDDNNADSTNTYSTNTYSTNKGNYTIDTIEGAFVTVDYQKIVQQPASNGWWITVNNEATQFNTLTLKVIIEGGRRAIVLVNYTKQEDQERRIFGNTATGDLGTWIPLLPRAADNDKNTISSGAKTGEQLYLRVAKILR